MRNVLLSVVPVLFLTYSGLVACSAGEESQQNQGSRALQSESLNDNPTPIGDPGLSGDALTRGNPAPPGCGDGELTPDEACDHGESPSEYMTPGCFANCLGIDPGYICPDVGQDCKPFAKCGDGIVAFPEQCDDSARVAGDGCSDNCKVELGYKCDTPEAGSSVCVATTCGDGVVEGSEMCEPSIDGARCTAQCQIAPICDSNGCTSECGDGTLLDEDCDDGNLIDGDGCSSTCKVESGYMCGAQEGECTKDENGTCILDVPVVFRDFAASHPSFEIPCGSTTPTLNMMAADLVDGKPVPVSTGGACTNTTGWYETSSENVEVNTSIRLYDDGSGGFVNRYGSNGEKFKGKSSFQKGPGDGWCANAGGSCDDCSEIPEGFECFVDGCPTGGPHVCVAKEEAVYYDGTPLFFPLDGMKNPKQNDFYEAKIAALYGYDSWPWEKDVAGLSGGTHNFHFTTEVTYWFPFGAETDAVLNFTGDDDVWVYVNGKLALDLGGTHIPLEGSVAINQTTAAEYGLDASGNKVYEIKVFHAERKREGSSFRLTLSGFNARRSDCTAICGDGIIGFGEECDDGAANNLGGYNQCGADCLLSGGYCGDGKVDPGEDCDDADTSESAVSGCTGCRVLVLR